MYITDFRETKIIRPFSNCSITHVSMRSAYMACFLNARLTLLHIRQTDKAKELTDRLLQMESFKSGKDYSLISTYHCQQTALWTFVKRLKEVTLILIIPAFFPSTERPSGYLESTGPH